MKVRKILSILTVAVIALTFALAGCGSISVESVSLNKSSLELSVGATETLTAEVSPDNATDKSITWSSDKESIASVDENGKVTGVAVGTATITATVGGKTATCEVSVVVPVTGVTLDKDTLGLLGGESETLVATIAPANATNKNVTWSSENPEVATVDQSGKVTGVSSGTVKITAKTVNGGFTDECTVTVTVPVSGVTLNESTLRIAVGENETLTATVVPTGATNKDVTWSSDNTSVATVDNSGKVTGVSAGTAVITVTTDDGDETASCTVTVFVPVTGVSIDKQALKINKGNTATLIETVSPANATNKDVTWSSDDEDVCTVSSSGVVTAVDVGTAEITVTTEDGSYTATCAVTVVIPVSGVSISPATLYIAEGAFGELTATITPADATNKIVSWASDKTSVATVDNNGKVTGVAAGTATITVTTEDGEETATCAVEVYDFDTKQGELTLSAELTHGHVTVGDGANSLVTVTTDAPGTVYYSTDPDLTSRTALMNDPDTTIVEVEAGVTYIQLDIEDTSVTSASILLVEENEGINVGTQASDIITLEWEEFFTPDTSSGEIATWTDLKAALQVNADITLACNIDAGGEDYAPTLSNFTSKFDGNGYFIIDFKLKPAANEFGLFKTVRTCEFVDLTFLNPVIEADAFTQGGLLFGANSEGGANVITISNVDVINLQHTASGENNGGLIGYIKGAEASVEMTDCDVSSTVVSSHRYGGMIGYVDWNSKVSIYDSSIDIHFKDCTSGNHKGGVIGRLTSSNAELTISGCTVNVSVTDSTFDYFGGALGSLAAATAQIIDTNININLINSKSSRQGGAVGQLESGATLDVKDCSLSTKYDGGANDERKGGVVGQQASSNTKLNVSNCYIEIDIAKTGVSAFGGIEGAFDDTGSVDVKFCYVKMNASAAPGSSNVVFGFHGSANGTANVSDSIFVTNFRTLVDQVYGQVWNSAPPPVTTNIDIKGPADAINSDIAAAFADDEINITGFANWIYDATTNTLTFIK